MCDRTGPGQSLHPCGGRFERDELQRAAVEARPHGVALVTVAAVVCMRMRRMGRGAGRRRVGAIIAGLRAMKARCRPRDLERQHNQQEQHEVISHGAGV